MPRRYLLRIAITLLILPVPPVLGVPTVDGAHGKSHLPFDPCSPVELLRSGDLYVLMFDAETTNPRSNLRMSEDEMVFSLSSNVRGGFGDRHMEYVVTSDSTIRLNNRNWIPPVPLIPDYDGLHLIVRHRWSSASDGEGGEVYRSFINLEVDTSSVVGYSEEMRAVHRDAWMRSAGRGTMGRNEGVVTFLYLLVREEFVRNDDGTITLLNPHTVLPECIQGEDSASESPTPQDEGDWVDLLQGNWTVTDFLNDDTVLARGIEATVDGSTLWVNYPGGPGYVGASHELPLAHVEGGTFSLGLRPTSWGLLEGYDGISPLYVKAEHHLIPGVNFGTVSEDGETYLSLVVLKIDGSRMWEYDPETQGGFARMEEKYGDSAILSLVRPEFIVTSDGTVVSVKTGLPRRPPLPDRFVPDNLR